VLEGKLIPELCLPSWLVSVEAKDLMKTVNGRFYFSLLIITLLLAVTGLRQLKAQDQVTLSNTSGNPIGLLIDGKLGGSFANDKTYVSPGSPALVGQFSSINGNKPNEIMAFTQDRPPAVFSHVPWTPGNDNIAVPFANKILIPVTIWIVYGDFNSASTKALNDVLTTSTIYGTERVGVDFSTVNIIDATTNPKAAKYYDYDYYTMAAGLKADIGYVPGQVNIYYVHAMNWSGILYTNSGEARQEGAPWIMLGSAAMNVVLAHEIGHLMALAHVHSGAPTQWFDYTNMMTTSGSPSSRFITEGQVLRMHLSSNSVLNTLYNARPGLLIRDCNPTSTKATDTCPGVQKRIWADGTYPAN
jgi:hypothetical protein